MAQVVPIKLDTGSEVWQTWARKHKAEGKGIPIVYVVRADGETLYANSGTLNDNQLKILLTAAMNNAGLVLGEKDVNILTEVTKQFQEFRLNGDPKSALKSLKPAKRYLGKSGQVGSYAKPAIDLNQEIRLLVQAANDSIQDVANQVEKAKEQSEEEQIRAIQKYLGIKDQYADLKPSKSELSRIYSNLRKNEQMKSLYDSIRILDMAAAAKSASQKSRYRDKLQKLLETTPFPGIKSRAETILGQLQD